METEMICFVGKVEVNKADSGKRIRGRVVAMVYGCV